MAGKRKLPPRSKAQIALDMELARIRRESYLEASRMAFLIMLGLPAMVLADKCGWGKEETQDFCRKVYDLYMAFESGHISLEDVHHTLRDELELDVVMLDERGRRVY